MISDDSHTLNMACFICNEKDHWAKNCPLSVCNFCGCKGHTAYACGAQALYKPSVYVITKERQIAKSLEDILYENHLVVTKTYRADVDQYISKNFKKNGMVDSYDVAQSIFEDGACAYSVVDKGHLIVLGYIIGKYCDAYHPDVKDFLSKMCAEMDCVEYRKILSHHFGITCYEKGGKLHFRKMTGYVV